MVFPAAVGRIPLPRVGAFEQNVRYNARHSGDKEKYRAHHRKTQTNTNDQWCGDIFLNMIGNERLNPKVNGARAKASERPDEMHDANLKNMIRLVLELSTAIVVATTLHLSLGNWQRC